MTIDKFNFAGKKAIVRVDFNVPLDENGKIKLLERWQWLNGDCSTGESVLVEI